MKKLTFRETIFVASMLFGMFFGAGNLIFPVSMGQMAGRNMWQAVAIHNRQRPQSGSFCTQSWENGLQDHTAEGKKFGIFFNFSSVSDNRSVFLRCPDKASVSLPGLRVSR